MFSHLFFREAKDSMTSKKVRWQPLSQSEKMSEELESLTSEDSAAWTKPSWRNTSRFTGSSFYLAIALLASIIINFSMYIHQRRVDLDQVCTEHTSISWAPMLEHRPMTYSDVFFNESLFEVGPYRQPPSPEVDKTWNDLGLHLRASIVTEEQAQKAGLPSGHVKRKESQGGGYLVSVEVLHNLHCLNVLRQTSYLYNDYYKENGLGVWVNSETLVRLHIGHCIDDLRQQLMCTADMGLIPQVWVNTTSLKTFPYFNNQHKCKDYNIIREWAEQNQVNEGDLAEYHEGDLVFDRYDYLKVS